MKKREGAFLGIGFWAGMGLMSLIDFIGAFIFIDNNYYVMRYGLAMFIISLIFVIIGLIVLHNTNRRK